MPHRRAGYLSVAVGVNVTAGFFVLADGAGQVGFTLEEARTSVERQLSARR
jgi:hypothetical protein